jgi:hypothetical protein
VNTEPERTTGTRCNTPISGGILSFPCTLAANHEASGEPHYAVEVDRSVRAWRTWKEQTLMAQQASDAEGQQMPVGGVIEELPGGVTISRTTDTETIHPMVVNLRPEPTKQREGDQRLPDGDETVVDDQALLIADIEARRQVGIARYGQGHCAGRPRPIARPWSRWSRRSSPSSLAPPVPRRWPRWPSIGSWAGWLANATTR